METFLKDKKIKISILAFVIIVSLLMVAKLVNEVKLTSYVGRDNQRINTISVSGEGEVTAVSDIASLSVNLNKDGATAKEAQELLNKSITDALVYLKDQKIDDKDIKSEYGGLNPKYSYEKCYTYPCPSNQKIIGYTATQSITIKVRDVDNASVIKTGLAGIGITDISGPTFSIDDEKGFQNQARSLAIDEAKIKAETLAKELGVKLGKIINFSEGSDNNYLRYAKTMEVSSGVMSDSSVSVPTLPKGENKITSNVTITYEIR